MRTLLTSAFVAAALVLIPVGASAQTALSGAISGSVRDASGAVMPGVTVEAASPALIEKVRTAVTDAQGNYRITDLRPGTYSVTFTLPGFTTFRREGVELTTGFTAAINAELKVGGVEETVTVTGASPIVDVQNVLSQQVLSRETLDSTPTAKTLTGFASLTVGIVAAGSGGPDVGGQIGEGTINLMVHGSRGGDMHVNMDGLSGNGFLGSGGGSGRHTYYNHAAVEEVSLQTAAVSAESTTGGVEINAVPKEGGNTFQGVFNVDGAGSGMQGTNVSDEQRAQGLTQAGIDYLYDVNGGVGGPIRQDKLWFYAAARRQESWHFPPGIYYNLTPGTLFYEPDLSRPGRRGREAVSESLRVTWQAAPKHKIGLSFSHDGGCDCYGELQQSTSGSTTPGTALASPDGSKEARYDPVINTQVSWLAPVTNRLLLESRVAYFQDTMKVLPQPDVPPGTISVTDTAIDLRYGSNYQRLGLIDYGFNRTRAVFTRSSVSYITGSHAMKVGVTTRAGSFYHEANPFADVAYSFNNRVPVSLTQIARPRVYTNRIKLDLGVFAQDQWTVRRLTLNPGIRFDYFNAYTPAQTRPGGTFLAPFEVDPVYDTPSWKDISPRLGAAYDVFGNGKTAIKASVGRYNIGETTATAIANNPAVQVVSFVNRTWNDNTYPEGDPRRGNYVPDCDLPNLLANGECGQVNNLRFGTPVANSTYDPGLLDGWQVRPYSWQTSVTVQQELAPGFGVTVGYYRTSYGAITVTDNVLVTPADYDPYCVTAPTDSRLPGGGGYEVCGFYDIKPTSLGRVQNVIKDSEDFGGWSEVFDGIDVSFTARFGDGGQLGGGLSTGRTVTDECNVVDSPQGVTSGVGVPHSWCRNVLPWSGQTQFKANAVYPLPWEMQVAVVYQNTPGIPILASYVARNAEIAPSLGRDLASCRGAAVCNGQVVVNVIEPNTVFGDRINELDLRFTKMVRIGRVRIDGRVDLYNVFNANTVWQLQSRFGPEYLRPSGIQGARLLKLGASLNF